MNLQKLLKQTVKTPTGCWIWQSAFRGQQNPYGCVKIGGRRGSVQYVHRLVYEFVKGPIAPGLYVLHKCNIKLCCNPAHLEVGTAQDNARQAVADGLWKGPSKAQLQEAARTLTKDQVAEIKEALKVRKWGQMTKLAKTYKVSISTISLIGKGQIWN